ncbi:MAG: DUF4388 domain-containing protein [Geobacter sp.]|nr:DUF4388 domain-containing protein [Geobacter sp.]
MSFVGDLEHLPIVDVIQLLHATRKSGTLCLKSEKGESQLVFSDGCIVSANHANNSVRIGQILVQMNVITNETLNATLAEQKSSGAARVPLIATLIETGKIKKEDAFRGLETLIEMTIVEVLTWTEGTFELDVDATVVSDEYRYIPEKLKLDLNLNTQNVLMDALRIYDEKMRDGTLNEQTFPREELPEPASVNHSGSTSEQALSDRIISIDDLGLDVMDDLEKVIPGFFTPVKTHDPTMIHREKVGMAIDELPQEEQERLFAYLSVKGEASLSDQPSATTHAMILFSSSEFIRHTVMTVCKQDGYFTFATDEEENLEHIISQALAKNLIPVMIIDQNPLESHQYLAALTRKALAVHPELAIFHILSEADFVSMNDVMRCGARAALLKPDSRSRSITFVDDTIYFLETVRKCLKITQPAAAAATPKMLLEAIDEISALRELPEITAATDRYLAMALGRAVTFSSRKSEIHCDSICRQGSSQPFSITLSIDGDSALHKAFAKGELYYGETSDQLLHDKLYETAGAPAASTILLAPLKCLGRVIAVAYADFGSKQPTSIQIDLITTLFKYAGVVYENALYRKKFEKLLQSQR